MNTKEIMKELQQIADIVEKQKNIKTLIEKEDRVTYEYMGQRRTDTYDEKENYEPYTHIILEKDLNDFLLRVKEGVKYVNYELNEILDIFTRCFGIRPTFDSLMPIIHSMHYNTELLPISSGGFYRNTESNRIKRVSYCTFQIQFSINNDTEIKEKILPAICSLDNVIAARVFATAEDVYSRFCVVLRVKNYKDVGLIVKNSYVNVDKKIIIQ